MSVLENSEKISLNDLHPYGPSPIRQSSFFLVLNMNNWVSNVVFLQVITNVTTRAGVFSHSFASVLLLRRITD